jgi:hypothetical protein
MKQEYAVVWSSNGDSSSGRLELFGDRFELHGRNRRVAIRFEDLTSVSIARGRGDRLIGLPVLALSQRGGPPLRIASLEGAGSLHEVVERIERSGRAVLAR